MNQLEQQLLNLAIGFVAFLVTTGGVIGFYAIRYMRVRGEAMVEEAEAKRAEARAAATARLAKIGELAAAAAEEQARVTGIKGEEKAVLATAIARGMIDANEPDGRGRRDLLETAVQAGVSKLRASMPATTYQLSADLVADIVRTASGRPPPALPPLPNEPKTFPRPPRMPGSMPGGGGTK